MIRFLILALFASVTCAAQTVAEFDGGLSNFQGSGAGAVLYSSSGETRFAGGLVGGRFVYNASQRTEIRGWSLDVGDTSFSVSGGQLSLSVPIRGVAAIREKKHSRFEVFTGAIGQITSSPFAFGIEQAHLGGGLAYKQDVGAGLTLGTIQAATALQKTSLGEFDFKPSCGKGPQPPLAGAGVSALSNCWWKQHFEFRGQGGVLSNNRQISGDAEMVCRHFNATGSRAEYIFTPQPGTAAFTPVSTQLIQRVTVNSGSVYAGASLLSGGASIFQSNLSTGKNYSVNSTLGWLQVSASTFTSHSTRFGKQSGSLLSVSERLGLHLSLQEYASKNGGQWNYNAGFSYNGNKLSATVGYSILYFPALPSAPFQKVLSVTIGFHFRAANLSVGTIALPTGKTNWTVSGGDYVSTPLRLPVIPGAVKADVRSLPSAGHGGKFVISGQVVDDQGSPVSGACINIGTDTVYTNSQGVFSIREKKRDLPIRIDLNQFLSGEWTVVVAPSETQGQEIRIVVKRKP